MLRAAIVMKCECFQYITELCDYLENNLIIARYCVFDIAYAAKGLLGVILLLLSFGV